MNTKDVVSSASKHLAELSGYVFDVITITKPASSEAAINLSKVISKLSPILGNLIEFNTVEFLNSQSEYGSYGTWKRQDPGFPDAIFHGNIKPTPGFEIKAWFPLATEITARFKDSQNHFSQDQTHVCLLSWLPEKLIYGKPQIIDVCVVSGKSIAIARDNHYHSPPDYIVLEPEDTSSRSLNLQQTNTNGHKWQGTPEQFAEACQLVRSWGADKVSYDPGRDYQTLLRELFLRYPYRLDTNYAKMDRIGHPEIEQFKTRVMNTDFNGMKIMDWAKLIKRNKPSEIEERFKSLLNINQEKVAEIPDEKPLS